MKRLLFLALLTINYSLFTVYGEVTPGYVPGAFTGTYLYTVSGDNATITGVTGQADWTVGDVIIPETVTDYYGTYSVTAIDEQAFMYFHYILSITIPNSVTTIGKRAIYGCINMETVIIGNSVTTIEQEAFGYNTQLATVIFLCTTPPTLGTNVFMQYPPDYYVSADRYIYVPHGSEEAYKAAAGWSQYANYILTDPTTITYVTFNLNYSGAPSPATQSVSPEGLITIPQNASQLSRTGHKFNGWYTQAQGGSFWDFNTVITENITLYARWMAIPYTVILYGNGGSFNSYGAPPATFPLQYINYGATLTEPETMYKSGYTFDGWFTTPNFTPASQWNFYTDTITNDLTLYAKWHRN